MAVVVAAIVAGCGGGSDSTTSADPKAAFIASADQICADAGARINERSQALLDEHGSDVATGAFVVRIFTEITIPELQKMFDRMAALDPPPGAEEQVDEIIAAGNEALRKARAHPKLLAKPAGQGNPFDEVNGLEQDFGFEFCGGGNA